MLSWSLSGLKREFKLNRAFQLMTSGYTFITPESSCGFRGFGGSQLLLLLLQGIEQFHHYS